MLDKHGVDGSCLQMLEQHDLETEIGVRSKIARKKIMKWVESGFQDFNVFLDSKTTQIHLKNLPTLPPAERSSTSMLREKIKPENINEKENLVMDHNELIVTTYEGPHANFYTIKQSVNPIGRSQRNSIVVLEESAAKFHAEIRKSNAKFYIKDLGTDSGTFIKIFGK